MYFIFVFLCTINSTGEGMASPVDTMSDLIVALEPTVGLY